MTKAEHKKVRLDLTKSHVPYKKGEENMIEVLLSKNGKEHTVSVPESELERYLRMRKDFNAKIK